MIVWTTMSCTPILDHLAEADPAFRRQGGPCAAGTDSSDMGALLPIALGGRTSLQSLSQASHFRTASPRLMNQCAFRHSARNLPLKLSMNALSVALPGREKSSVTPFM